MSSWFTCVTILSGIPNASSRGLRLQWAIIAFSSFFSVSEVSWWYSSRSLFIDWENLTNNFFNLSSLWEVYASAPYLITSKWRVTWKSSSYKNWICLLISPILDFVMVAEEWDLSYFSFISYSLCFFLAWIYFSSYFEILSFSSFRLLTASYPSFLSLAMIFVDYSTSFASCFSSALHWLSYIFHCLHCSHFLSSFLSIRLALSFYFVLISYLSLAIISSYFLSLSFICLYFYWRMACHCPISLFLISISRLDSLLLILAGVTYSSLYRTFISICSFSLYRI